MKAGNTTCPQCGIECYTAKLLEFHTGATSCNRYRATHKPKKHYDRPIRWEPEPVETLSFTILLDRIADKFHFDHGRPDYDKRRNPITKLATISGITATRLRALLVSRTEDDPSLSEVDAILRAMGLDLRAIMTGDDTTPLPDDWDKRRNRIRRLATAMDQEIAIGLTALAALSDDIPQYAHDLLEARLGSIIEKLDAIRLVLKIDWTEARPLKATLPKSKAEYKRQLLTEQYLGKKHYKP